MIKYTNEMMKQDELWEEEKEDFEIMGKLYGEIMQESVNQGFLGKYVIYDACNEKIIDIHLDDTEEPEVSFGFCKPLINWMNNHLTTRS